MMIDFKPIFGLFTCLLFAFTGSAQPPAESPSKFDLIIFGKNLDSRTEVFLKENPGTTNNWQKLDSGRLISDEKKGVSTLLFSNLSTKKFAGQDIRENYIAIKITPVEDRNQLIRALYALPHVDHSQETLQKIGDAIQSDPQQIKTFSLANLVFPRSQSISGDNEFIEHIEMPVRHLKPGVQEVEWLDVIFSKK